MPTRNIELTEHYESFLDASVESGRYHDASETVRAALRLLEQREREDEAKIAWLRSTAEEAFAALDRGEGIELSSDEDVDSFINEAVARARTSRIVVHA